MAQGVDAALLGDSGKPVRPTVGTLGHAQLHRLDAGAVAKQPGAWTKVAHVLAQERQQGGTEQGVATATAFAAGHTHAHAVTVALDVAHAQHAGLRYPQSGGVDGLQQHAPDGVRTHCEQTGELLA